MLETVGSHLKLFLDIVPSSSADITSALRAQPKRLSRNYRRQIGGNVIIYVLIPFHSREIYSLHFQPSFCSAGLSFVELFFCKKIPLSRRVDMLWTGGSWFSGSAMYVCHTNQIGSTIKHQSNFLL